MIGIFDSGSGGLSILSACKAALPNHDFLYLGDHANAPYGARDNREIVEFTQRNIHRLFNHGCNLVILACNTAAAVALRELQQTWLPHAAPDKRILGVLVPTVEAITGQPWLSTGQSHHRDEAVTIFATPKTVDSNAFADEIIKRAPNMSIQQIPCPGLVAAIESEDMTAARKEIEKAASEAKQPLGNVLLGCTHYPLVQDVFHEILGDDVPLYAQPNLVANSLKDYLARHPNMGVVGTGDLNLLTTGPVANADRLAQRLFHDHWRYEAVKD